MVSLRILFVVLLSAIAVPALAEDDLRLPGGYSLGGYSLGGYSLGAFNWSGGGNSGQVRLFSLNGGATSVNLGAAFSAPEMDGFANGAGSQQPRFTLRVDHALGAGVIVGGTAASQRFSAVPDGSDAQIQYLVGARVGVRF